MAKRFLSQYPCRGPRSAGNPQLLESGRATADLVDAQLHTERLGPDRSKPKFRAQLEELPDGVFVCRDKGEENACLLWRGHLLVWSPGGYCRERFRSEAETVTVLTPRSTLAAIRKGYVPEVHPTARF